MSNEEENRISVRVKRVPCEVYSRIVGYLRPVQNWNKGKQQEFAERKPYAVPEQATLDKE
ncbi:MAG: anaerobic ribonucleoside-triphosphate reductase [Candidatus Hadarchaeum sp.]